MSPGKLVVVSACAATLAAGGGYGVALASSGDDPEPGTHPAATGGRHDAMMAGRDPGAASHESMMGAAEMRVMHRARMRGSGMRAMHRRHVRDGETLRLPRRMMRDPELRDMHDQMMGP